MKRQVLVVVLAVLLFLGTLVPHRATATDLSFLQSIVAVTMPLPDGNGIGYLARGCTAGSIGPHEWVTAGHCVAQYTTHRYYILGDEVTVMKFDAQHDLARLHTSEASRPGLKVAVAAPRILDVVYVAGYPLGWKAVNATTGTVSGFQVMDVEGEQWPLTILAVTGAPGNSGSPVLNANFEIVGVIHVGFMPDTFSPAMGATPYEVFAAFLQ